MSREAKQRDFLNDWADRVRYSLEHGPRALKVYGLNTDSHEQILNATLSTLTADQIPNKPALTQALQAWEGEVGLMCHKWVIAFCNCDRHPFHEEYLDEPDLHKQRIANAYSKALEHRQNRGQAGFDGMKFAKSGLGNIGNC